MMMRTPLLLLTTAALAAGIESRVCAGCHRDIYDRYRGTPMGRSSGNVDELAPASFRTTSGHEYRVSGKTLLFEFEGEEVRRTLDYFVGAGVTGRTYLTSIDGFLFQAPISYYASTKSWDLSPGYVDGDAPNFIRAVEPSCLNCHASGVQTRKETVNGYAQPPFAEPGVACERCHRNAEQHVIAMKAGKQLKPDPVAAAACAQCHLPGVVTIGSSVFVWDGLGKEATVNGHFEQLARSRCAVASAGKLWCGTCHNPHRVGSAADYRGRCNACHSGRGKTNCAAVDRKSDDCIACHMPRTNAATVQHAALTDHTIPRRPATARSPADVPRYAKLKLFSGREPAPRDLGLAYASVALGQDNPIWADRAITLLEKFPPDARVLTQLAQLVERKGDQQRACELYERAVRAGASSDAAAVNLGNCYATRGDLTMSIRLWREALARNPGFEAARLNLAVALYRTGNREAARTTLQEGLRFNPASRQARALLAQLTE